MRTSWAASSMLTLSFFFLLFLTGCAMNDSQMKAPSFAGSLPVPPGTGTEAVFSCGEASLRVLHDRNELWNTRVTLRDVGGRRMETGDFSDDNVGGFRVSVQYSPESNVVRMELKGAGPYFMDLGVEKAYAELDAQMRRCFSSDDSVANPAR